MQVQILCPQDHTKRIEEALDGKTIYYILTNKGEQNRQNNFTNNAPNHNTDQRWILEIS